MSTSNFARNYADSDGPIERSDLSAKTTADPASAAEAFVRNFSDNQSPADADAPHHEIVAVPGTLEADDEAVATSRLERAANAARERGSAAMASSKKADEDVGDVIQRGYRGIQEHVQRTVTAPQISDTTEVREDLPLQ